MLHSKVDSVSKKGTVHEEIVHTPGKCTHACAPRSAVPDRLGARCHTHRPARSQTTTPQILVLACPWQHTVPEPNLPLTSIQGPFPTLMT